VDNQVPILEDNAKSVVLETLKIENSLTCHRLYKHIMFVQLLQVIEELSQTQKLEFSDTDEFEYELEVVDEDDEYTQKLEPSSKVIPFPK